MAIKLTDVAIHFKNLEHQVDALNYLQSNIPADVLAIFEQKWRTPETKPAPPPVVTQENSWDGVYQMAKKAGAKFPECVCAQWALESGWGKHTSGKNNYFGLKGSGSSVNTQEFINGKWVEIKAGFIDFPDIATCVTYLVDRWYKDFSRFKGVNRATSRNECAKLLVVEKYATDPDYSTKLIQIMDREIGTSGSTEKPLFNPWSPFNTKITPNITYGEICKQEEKRRFIKTYQCETAKEICLFLERARKHFGNRPLIITSGSRPEPINTAVGGAKNSEHTYDEADKGAIDWFIEGVDIYKVQEWCVQNWPYSTGLGAKRGFIHTGIRPGRPKVVWNY